MKQTQIIMGMPITVEVIDETVRDRHLQKVFDYFRAVDKQFSTYKPESEISSMNQGKIQEAEYSPEMKEILALSEQTKQETGGYFDVRRGDGMIDPSGLVKGWAIYNAAKILWQDGLHNFFIEAGGDIQTSGRNAQDAHWQVGIRNPFHKNEIIKVLQIQNSGVATSGVYERGEHIYNPLDRYQPSSDIVSLTVVGPNIYEADRFATAAFAMGKHGIEFIEQMNGLEGYAVDKDGMGTPTSGFNKFATF